MQFCKTYNLANGNLLGTFAILLAMALLSSMPARAAEDNELTTNKELPAITMIPGDGMNLEITEQISSHYVVVNVNPPVHNWFAGTFINLPTDKEVTIGLSMEGMDTTGNKADVTKWKGLMPVMTYGDPMKYETYEWFQKDNQGRWVSGDPFKQGEAKYAGIGKTPEQSVIPKEVAEEFLSRNGEYWQGWREVDSAEAVANLNIFRIKQRFANPTVTVAMRILYTYTYLQQFIKKLQAAKLPGVFIDEIGTTLQGRKLQVIRIEDPSGTTAVEDMQTILMIAREHATEHSSSHALQGGLNAVLDRTENATDLRRGRTWLFIPIEDPDGSANGIFDRLTDSFRGQNNTIDTPEVAAYARFVVDFILKDKTIDLSISIHNVECNECANIFAPFIDQQHANFVESFNDDLFMKAKEHKLLVNNDKSWGVGMVPFRFYAWTAVQFGGNSLCYEVNDRYPLQRLSLMELQSIGGIMCFAISRWTTSDAGKQTHLDSLNRVKLHKIMRSKYFSDQMRPFSSCTYSELICYGY